MILADTSAWIEYDRATGSTTHLRLRELIRAQAELAVCPPVVAEVASGARTDRRERELRRLLGTFEPLDFDPATDFDGAVWIYRQCRQRGITPRSLLDCVIVNIAVRHGADLLAHDADMARLATVVPISLDEASLRA